MKYSHICRTMMIKSTKLFMLTWILILRSVCWLFKVHRKSKWFFLNISIPVVQLYKKGSVSCIMCHGEKWNTSVINWRKERWPNVHIWNLIVKKFRDTDWKFEVHDIVIYDLVVIRHTTMHLKISDVMKVIRNFLDSSSKFLLTTSFPKENVRFYDVTYVQSQTSHFSSTRN